VPGDEKWKEDADKALDKAKDGMDKETYDLLKRLLKAAKTIADFIKALDKEGLLAKLGSAKKIGTKAATVVIDILIQLVEAGPCPWTAIIVARINKLIADAMLEEETKETKARIKQTNRLKEKYAAIFEKCQKAANGADKPKDVNKAKSEDLKAAGVPVRLAKQIVEEALSDPFHTPNEVLRVPGVTREIQSKLLLGGFYFGMSGEDMLRYARARESRAGRK
jgi:hypothetical protein